MRDVASINCNEICLVILLSSLVGDGVASCRDGELFPEPYIVYRVSDESRYRQ